MTNGMIKIGGIAGIIWLVGIILASVGLLHVGGIVMGVGILLLGFAGIGFWQRGKAALSILAGIFSMIGGILSLAGGAVLFVNVVIGLIVFVVGAVLTGVSLILLGLILLREQSWLNTEARLGIDLAFPAALTTLIGGCSYLTGLIVTPAAPAALLCAIVFLLAS